MQLLGHVEAATFILLVEHGAEEYLARVQIITADTPKIGLLLLLLLLLVFQVNFALDECVKDEMRVFGRPGTSKLQVAVFLLLLLR